MNAGIFGWGAMAWVLAAPPPQLPNFSVWEIVGIVFVAIFIFEFVLYVTLYRRPRVDEALVRNGLGEVRVAVNHGLIVLPLVQSIKRVNLAEHTLNVNFAEAHALRWQGGERFEGYALITVQVPAESPQMVLAAARNLVRTDDADALLQLLEGVFRSTTRDTLRSIKQITFEIEPAAAEVRLTKALDLAATACGLRVRAVHLHNSNRDTGRLRRTLAKLDEPLGGDESTRGHRTIDTDSIEAREKADKEKSEREREKRKSDSGQ